MILCYIIKHNKIFFFLFWLGNLLRNIIFQGNEKNASYHIIIVIISNYNNIIKSNWIPTVSKKIIFTEDLVKNACIISVA